MFDHLTTDELESAVDFIHEQIDSGSLTPVEITEANIHLDELITEINNRLAREYPDE